MKPRPPLSQAFDVRLPEERVARAWRNISRAVPRRRRAGRWVGRTAAFSLLLAAMVLAVFTLRRRSDDTFEGAQIETGPGEQQTLQLADGSRLLLAPSTRLHLVHLGRRSVRLQLERGAFDASVTHVEGRTFVVTTGDIQIGVVGTRFQVAMDEDDGQVHVAVSEGRVRLTSTDGHWPESYVAAGQTWSSPISAALDGSSVATADAAASGQPPQPQLPPTRRAPAARRSPLPPGFAALYRQGRYAEAYATLGPDGFSGDAQEATPEELMMLAETARLSRHPSDAALAFDILRSRYPRDSRAALAALELGRLRLNELDDAEGAQDAFEDAIRLDPSGPLREDAEARRVEAIDRTGDRASCRTARDQYLVDHPQGVHTASVARMCR